MRSIASWPMCWPVTVCRMSTCWRSAWMPETSTPRGGIPASGANWVCPESGPLLMYAGRIDNEKRADRLLAMFRALPHSLGASMVMVGDGKLRAALMEAAEGLPVRFPGFVTDRAQLARMLASADIYVSAMADETFGLSVLEAQASGLPVVGFASGAMVQRVPPALGRLVPLDDTAAMATAVVEVWHGDHAAMGLRAREHVTTQFGWQRTFDMLLAEIYPRALARSAGTERGAQSGALAQRPTGAPARAGLGLTSSGSRSPAGPASVKLRGAFGETPIRRRRWS